MDRQYGTAKETNPKLAVWTVGKFARKAFRGSRNFGWKTMSVG